MKQEEAKKRIKKLRSEIARLRDLYHVKDAPEVTDEVSDSLMKELKSILSVYPEFNDPNSPENRVAGRPLAKFSKVKHEIKMFSIGNVFSDEELFAWEKRNLKLLHPGIKMDYFCELKFDGLAVSLIYEDGKLKRGATRGDGEVGEDITENLKMIKTIPLVLKSPYPKKVEVRGEAIMMKKVLEKLNRENEKKGKPLFANSRNAAAGSLRQLDPQLAKERDLDFFAYEVMEIKGEKWKKYMEKHSRKHELLEKLGFQTDKYAEKVSSLSQVPKFMDKISAVRKNLPFGIDGVVINVDDTEIFDTLGTVGKDPRGIIAFKYPAEKATTIVRDIKINVGRTGVLTPLAIFEPTSIAGSVVSKATLHNADQIERLGLKIGDTVVIEKAGDVIPKLVEVLARMRTGKEKKFKMPGKCPVCGGEIMKKQAASPDAFVQVLGSPRQKFAPSGAEARPDHSQKHTGSALSVAYYCTNPKCPAKNERYLEHFVSVFEIYELGPKILRRFKDEGLITDAADIFSLEKEDIATLPRFGEKSAENIIEEIKNKKKILFSKFLWALGILHVGEETGRDLSSNFGTLENLMKASKEDLENIENIGEAVSKSVYDFFRDKNNLNFIKKLEKNGVVMVKDEKQKGGDKFSSFIFVLTGTLSAMSREMAKEKIISLGGKISSSVSKNVSYVVAGSDPGSKLSEAKRLNVKILTEDEFFELLNK